MTERESVLTCPECGSEAEEVMPPVARRTQYECLSCGVVLRPRPGDDCVFCSYGSVPCPPVQMERAGDELVTSRNR